MNKKELLESSDDELLKKAKKLKSDSIINALLIGFCIGIIIWSVAKNTWGFTLIPLFFIYLMVNNSKNDKDLKEVLKERNLK